MSVRFASVTTAPSFTSSAGIGTRTISWTSFAITYRCSEYGFYDYACMRIYDATAGTVLYTSNSFTTSIASSSRVKQYSAGSASISMPASTATHTIRLQYGETGSHSTLPTSWKDITSYSVSITGKRTFNITYYDYAGASYHTATGGEADYHTVYTPTGLSRFDHWNTASDDSGTSYLPNSTRYVNGDLLFYAIRGAGATIKAKVNGLWVDGEPKVKVGGVWKDVDSVFAKVNGAWKEI